MKYAVIIEKGTSSVGAHVPDLPGCVAVGKTVEEAVQLITEAVHLHLEQMRTHGEAIPAPSIRIEYVESGLDASPRPPAQSEGG